MGGKQSTEEKLEILNDTKVQTALSNVNENINNMTMDMIQKNLQQTAASATQTQEIEISGLTSGGDIVIGEVSQEQSSEINVSALADQAMQADMVSQVQQELQTKLQEAMEVNQESASSQGEQIFGALADALGGAMASVTGTDVDSSKETSIRNMLDIQSSTELQNKLEQNVSTEMVSETVQEVSNSIVGDQKSKITDLTAGGNIQIAKVSQKQVAKQILDAVSKQGITSQIAADMTGISKAEIDKSITAGQTGSSEEKGTLDSFGDMVGSVVGSAMFLPIILVGGGIVVLLIVLMMMSGRSSATPQYGGGKNIINYILKFVKKIIKLIIKYIKKGLKMLNNINKDQIKNILLGLICFFVLESLYKKFFRRTENFKDIEQLKSFYLSINGLYVTKNGKKVCLGSKEKALKFKQIKLDDMTTYLLTDSKKIEYLKINEENKISIEKYNASFDEDFKIKFLKENESYLFRKDNMYIGINAKNCLEMKPKKEYVKVNFEV